MTRRLLAGVLLLAAGVATAPAAFADLGINISGFSFDPNPMTIGIAGSGTFAFSNWGQPLSIAIPPPANISAGDGNLH